MNDPSESMATTLALYGHPYSSYTWKVLIALYGAEVPFEYRLVDREHPENVAFVQQAGPLGKIPVISDGDNIIFEASSIIEYLSRRHAAQMMIVPDDPDAAIGMRMLDRVFDNYVMGPVSSVVHENLRDAPDQSRINAEREKLARVYQWLEGWLEFYPPMDHVTLIECAAAPALHFADIVLPIGGEWPRLQNWLSHLLHMPPVAQCIADAEPYRDAFPIKRTEQA